MAVKRRSPKRHFDVKNNYRWDSACGIMTYADRLEVTSKIKGITSLPPEEAHSRLTAVAAEPGGFRTHCVRREAWPLLCGLKPHGPRLVTNREARYDDYEQLVMDVDRCMWNFCPDEEQRNKLRAALLRIMNAILLDHPELHYYQAPSPYPRSEADPAAGCLTTMCVFVCWRLCDGRVFTTYAACAS